MKKLLLIAALALMSGACASARPEYYLVPPVSVVAPVVSEVTTPRPPAPEETVIVIDEVEVAWPPGMEPEATPRPPLPVSASNNLKGKLNKQLAPHIKIDWSKQAATAPVAVTKSAPSTEDLKNQVQNLLAQNNSLQNALDDRRPSKLERYARELGDTKAELKTAQAERDKALNDYILSVQEGVSLKKKISQLKSLKSKKDAGDMQWWVISWNQSRDKTASLRDWIIGGMLSLLVLAVFVYVLGLRNGEANAESVASERITALKTVNEGKNLHIRELRKENTELKVKLERRRVRIHVLKRQRAGPLPETVDDDPPLGEDEPPDSVFGPLEREEREE